MYGVDKVEGRRPRRTWLENIEADMAELEIDKEEEVHHYYCIVICAPIYWSRVKSLLQYG